MQTIGLLFRVLWSPGETMLLLSKSPRVLVPLVFLSLFSLLTGVGILMKVDSAELTMRAIERTPQGASLSDEQKAQFRQRMNSPIVKGFTIAASVINPLILVLVVAAIYFGVFTLLGREGSFKAFFSITAFAFVPGIFRQLAAVLAVSFVPSSALMLDELGSLSPAVFIDRDSVSPVVFTILNSIDLISIWILTLLVIGYGFLTRKTLSKTTRAIAVVSIFLVYVAVRVAYAGLRGI
jgi:hypothetical protein